MDHLILSHDSDAWLFLVGITKIVLLCAGIFFSVVVPMYLLNAVTERYGDDTSLFVPWFLLAMGIVGLVIVKESVALRGGEVYAFVAITLVLGAYVSALIEDRDRGAR